MNARLVLMLLFSGLLIGSVFLLVDSATQVPISETRRILESELSAASQVLKNATSEQAATSFSEFDLALGDVSNEITKATNRIIERWGHPDGTRPRTLDERTREIVDGTLSALWEAERKLEQLQRDTKSIQKSFQHSRDQTLDAERRVAVAVRLTAAPTESTSANLKFVTVLVSLIASIVGLLISARKDKRDQQKVDAEVAKLNQETVNLKLTARQLEQELQTDTSDKRSSPSDNQC